MRPGLPYPSTRRHRVALRVLPGALIAVLVIFGLLAMHGIGLHGSAVCHGSEGPRTDATSVVPGSDATTALGVIAADASAPTTVGDEGPGDCGDLVMVMVCVFVLLLLVPLLRPPRQVTTWARRILRLGLAIRVAFIAPLPRAPSLHVLCISRT